MASDALGPQWKPVSADEARGTSKPVTMGSARKMAKQGKKILDSGSADSSGLADKWHQVRDMAWEASRQPYGGVTVNASSGDAVNPQRGWAVAARRPGQDQVSVHQDDSRGKFNAAMDTARAGLQAGHLGIFHDDDKGTVDIDPVHIASSKKEAHAVGSYTHAAGGAYNFADFDHPAWTPHVR